MALNLNSNINVADNEIVLRNQFGSFVIGKVTDEVATQIQQLVLGVTHDFKTSTTVPVASVEVPVEKPSYTKSYKDSVLEYKVEKLQDESNKVFYCIKESKNYRKTLAHKAGNKYISQLEGITPIKVAYTTEDGKKRSYTAYGYKTKKEATEKAAALPKLVLGEELNKVAANDYKF